MCVTGRRVEDDFFFRTILTDHSTAFVTTPELYIVTLVSVRFRRAKESSYISVDHNGLDSASVVKVIVSNKPGDYLLRCPLHHPPKR